MNYVIKFKEIGEKFIIDGDILECVESDEKNEKSDCELCYFNNKHCNWLINCEKQYRKDRKEVWFKLVSAS